MGFKGTRRRSPRPVARWWDDPTIRFHDGQPVTAEDCVVSLSRWGKRDALGRMLMAATGKLQASDKKTFVLELKSPFGIVLEALAKPSSNVPFIMPARLAATPDTEQVKEAIGSGPAATTVVMESAPCPEVGLTCGS